MVLPALRAFAASAAACVEVVLVTVLVVGAARACAQQVPDPGPAAERWIASDQTSRDALDATVKGLLAEPGVGIAWLGARLPAALAAPSEPRSKGVQSLCTHTILEYCRRQRATDITFDGQYAALLPLQ